MGTLLVLAMIHLLSLMSPGPDVLLVLRQSIRRDAFHALLCAFGITLGIASHLVLMYTGVSFLIVHAPLVYDIVVVLGAFWLFYLGFYAIFLSKVAAINAEQKTFGSYKSSLLQGYLNNALNPKAFIYFTSVVAPFMRQNGQHFFFVFIVLVSISLLWFLSLACLLRFPRAQRIISVFGGYIEKVFGIILVLLAFFVLMRVLWR